MRGILSKCFACWISWYALLSVNRSINQFQYNHRHQDSLSWYHPSSSFPCEIRDRRLKTRWIFKKVCMIDVMVCVTKREYNYLIRYTTYKSMESRPMSRWITLVTDVLMNYVGDLYLNITLSLCLHKIICAVMDVRNLEKHHALWIALNSYAVGLKQGRENST